MGITQSEPRALGWRFWLLWLLVSLGGSGAGVLCWVSLGSALEAGGTGAQTPGSVDAALLSILAGAAFGAPFGLAQWYVLRRRLRRADRWILASTLGYALVFLLGFNYFPGENAVAFDFSQQVLLGLGLGAAVSLPSALLQWWLVLRGQVLLASLWVAASLLSWAVGFALSFALAAVFDGLSFIGGVVVAIALTGLAMLWLLRRPAPG